MAQYERKKAGERRDLILDAALQVAARVGYRHIKRDEIAEAAGVSAPLVSVYFKTMIEMRRQIMRAAVERECLAVIAQGLSDKNPHAVKAPLELKERALASLIQ